MEWLKIQKLEYLENGTEFCYEIKKFLICASDDTFWKVIRFVADVTFKVPNGVSLILLRCWVLVQVTQE